MGVSGSTKQNWLIGLEGGRKKFEVGTLFRGKNENWSFCSEEKMKIGHFAQRKK
jgi:hypothetical protein